MKEMVVIITKKEVPIKISPPLIHKSPPANFRVSLGVIPELSYAYEQVNY